MFYTPRIQRTRDISFVAYRRQARIRSAVNRPIRLALERK